MYDSENNGFMSQHKIAIAVIGGIVLCIMIMIYVFLSRQKYQAGPYPEKKNQLEQSMMQPPNSTQDDKVNNNAAQPVEIQKALDEAQQSAREYDARLETLHTDYPWLRKLPYTQPNFFVYFDLETNAFKGKIYTTQGEDSEVIKTKILNEMRVNKQIPVESYPITWEIIAKT